jgi:predicted SAM-dependent methyltransferase
LYLWLSREYPLQNRSGIALVFAAEGALSALWEEAGDLQVYRIDIDTLRDSDLLGDLTCLPIATESVDLLWCHHVLEHIGDDRAAIMELFRVLRPGQGELIVSVPMIRGGTTQEYGFADPAQNGHWRIYGNDFTDRLAESGFVVRTIDYHPPAYDQERYGIASAHFYICTKPVLRNQGSRSEGVAFSSRPANDQIRGFR